MLESQLKNLPFEAEMKNPIINMCLSGMIPTKLMTPHVPVTTAEIIQTTLNCAELGCTIFHIHPRDENGAPTWKKEIFKIIAEGIRSKNNKVLLSFTTSGRDWGDFERRSECLELEGDAKPDLASLTCGSLNFIKTASVNSPDIIHQLAIKMMDKGIKPELEIFEPGMLSKANHMLKTGIIKDDKPYFQFLLGSLGTSDLHPATFGAFHSLLPVNAEWGMAGIGQFQLQANLLALVFGGNIRVGIEDNIFYNREKKELATNEALVERLLRIMSEMGLKPATFEETRLRLGIRS
jgi:uncharacterized protein (DUF849 family)